MRIIGKDIIPYLNSVPRKTPFYVGLRANVLCSNSVARVDKPLIFKGFLYLICLLKKSHGSRSY